MFLPCAVTCRYQQGLTLLELLLVIVILSAVAYTSLAIVDNNSSQIRFEDTRNRLEMIKRAIIGDTSRTLNGQPEIRGFVADMGRLPLNIKELIEEPTDCDSGTAGDQSCPWSYDADTGLWAGWHGPYLPATSESGGTHAFRDGWGNRDGSPNFGWLFSIAGSNLTLQSYGMEGDSSGHEHYENDYPPTGSETLIAQNEYRVQISSASSGGLMVDFGAPASSSMPTHNLCLQIMGRSNGQIDSTPLLSGVVNVTWDGTPQSHLFSFSGTQYLSQGQMAYGVFEYDTSTSICTTNPYPGGSSWKLFSLVPGTVIQPLAWPVN